MEYFNNPLTIGILTIVNILQFIINLFLFVQKERYKSKLEKKIYVHKLQFESEFTLYKDLWAKLINVITELRYLVEDYKKLDENSEVEFKITYNLIVAKANGLNDIFTQNKPFYHNKIYILMIDMNKKVSTLMDNMKNTLDNNSRIAIDSKSYDDLINSIVSVCELICQEIRGRIGTN